MPRVLIVDDNIAIRKLMAETLQQFGLTDIQEAANGRHALEISRQQMPDVVTLDWNMPEMNGLEYLQALRQLPNGAHPKVIFCSTENREDKVKLVIAAGADEYITKPFDNNIIQEKLIKLGLI